MRPKGCATLALALPNQNSMLKKMWISNWDMAYGHPMPVEGSAPFRVRKLRGSRGVKLRIYRICKNRIASDYDTQFQNDDFLLPHPAIFQLRRSQTQ